MLADKNLVSQLIPQGHPIIMVDELISNTESVTVSSFTIKEDNIFCNDGFFREPGIVENIAQTAALRSGYEGYINNKKPAVGYIGSLKKLKIFELPAVKDKLITEIRIVSELMNALVIEGETRVGDRIIAKGNLNIFLQ